MTPPRLAFFDLDNTLIDRAEAFRAWAAAFASERRLGDEKAIAWLQEADNDGLSPRAEFFAHVRSRYDLVDPIEDLVAAYRRDYPRCVHPVPRETELALWELRTRGWKLAVVTNGGPSQAAKIAAAGLVDAVDGWAISEVVGARKPAPAIFQAAAAACSCSLDRAWMVGDSVEADIGGARACGLRSVWISRGRGWPEPSYRPDAVAESIASAVEFILTEDDAYSR